MEKKSFKVIIVGGSIAGLTLAHCLDRANIDYVILERRAEVAPQEGASLGIMPNGARILLQLGIYNKLEELIHPLTEAHLLYPDGFGFTSQYPKLLRERFGFPLAFIDRQKVLELLGASLPSPDRLHVSTKVKQVEELADGGVRVHTGDGDCYDGNIVVGADGVHSVVREEMWRLSGTSSAKITKDMQVQYACVFGISSPLPNLPPGKQITCYNKGWSILSVVGKNGRLYWFLFYKLDGKYNYTTAPRVSTEDAIRRCSDLASQPFWQHLSFGDVWGARERFNVTRLDEYVLPEWTHKNIICIGDSAHKIAPQTGQGANCAIEDATALANALHQLLRGRDPSTQPSPSELTNLLHNVAAERRTRMQGVVHSAKMSMRLQALDGLLPRLVARYYFPYAGDMLADLASKGIADAPLIDYIPVPARSGPGWDTFGKKSNKQKNLKEKEHGKEKDHGKQNARAISSWIATLASLALVCLLWFPAHLSVLYRDVARPLISINA
ncbi:hypothetical protein BJX64DRAFT_293212 [Aspergillus heterothallicus]